MQSRHMWKPWYYENPCKHQENMETSHRKTLVTEWKPRHFSCYETTMLTSTPLHHSQLKYCNVLKQIPCKLHLNQNWISEANTDIDLWKSVISKISKYLKSVIYFNRTKKMFDEFVNKYEKCQLSPENSSQKCTILLFAWSIYIWIFKWVWVSLKRMDGDYEAKQRNYKLVTISPNVSQMFLLDVNANAGITQHTV